MNIWKKIQSSLKKIVKNLYFWIGLVAGLSTFFLIRKLPLTPVEWYLASFGSALANFIRLQGIYSTWSSPKRSRTEKTHFIDARKGRIAEEREPKYIGIPIIIGVTYLFWEYLSAFQGLIYLGVSLQPYTHVAINKRDEQNKIILGGILHLLLSVGVPLLMQLVI